jgi:hypothetical protein
MNIVIKPNNIIFFKENDYILSSIEILNSTQILAYTDKGNVLLDLSCTIQDVSFTDINNFISALGIVEIIKEPTQEELIAQKEAQLLEMFEELKRLKTNG